MVHGLERPEHEEMKHLAVNRSEFTFPRAQVFQIHVNREVFTFTRAQVFQIHSSHSSGNYYMVYIAYHGLAHKVYVSSS